MQTFLPYPSFDDSAACLDYRRLGKQRVECKQILQALGVPVGGPLRDKPSSWRNHPATRMWKGHEPQLLAYAECICREWISRGYKDTLLEQFQDAWSKTPDSVFRRPDGILPLPAWLGWDEFHAAHRSNLLRKLPHHYSQFGWSEPDNLPYIWPTGTPVALSVA